MIETSVMKGLNASVLIFNIFAYHKETKLFYNDSITSTEMTSSCIFSLVSRYTFDEKASMCSSPVLPWCDFPLKAHPKISKY